MNKVKNHLLFLLYTVILGMIVGAIVWGFLRVMNLGIDFLWSFLPSQISFPLYTLCVCALGGLLIGLWMRKFGDYPEELGTVLGTVKKTGGYPYRNVFSTLGSALFPLLIGASVGPEAGLTGLHVGRRQAQTLQKRGRGSDGDRTERDARHGFSLSDVRLCGADRIG